MAHEKAAYIPVERYNHSKLL